MGDGLIFFVVRSCGWIKSGGIVGFIGFVIFVIGFGCIGNRRGFHFRSGSIRRFRRSVVDDGSGFGFRDGFGNRIDNGFREGCYFGDLIGVQIFLN